jgi:hypothetical protein
VPPGPGLDELFGVILLVLLSIFNLRLKKGRVATHTAHTAMPYDVN